MGVCRRSCESKSDLSRVFVKKRRGRERERNLTEFANSA